MSQGHVDLISHYSSTESGCEFLDCCWLANANDGYLAILLKSGDIELLSLSYSAIISNINLPESVKISSIFLSSFQNEVLSFLEIYCDPMDGERLFGVDEKSNSLHIFSFDSSVESPLIDSQALEESYLYECQGTILEVTKDKLKMRPLISNETEENSSPIFEISQGGKIEFAASRKRSKDTSGASEDDHFIIDHSGKLFYMNSEEIVKISSSVWSKRAVVAHDSDNLLLILCKDGNLALYDLDKRDFSVYSRALKSSSSPNNAICTFISSSTCCSQGLVKRVLIGDDTGTLNIYRIVK